MPEPWDPDWICKPRETDSWIAIIAYLEVEGGQLSPNPRRLKKASGLDLTRNRLPSAFFVPAYDDLSDASDSGSDSDYESSDDEVEIRAARTSDFAINKKFGDLSAKKKREFGEFLKEKAKSLMPHDTDSEVHSAIQNIFKTSSSGDAISNGLRDALIGAWNAKQFNHFITLASTLRGVGMTRSKIEAYLGFRIGRRKFTAIGFYLDKYGIGGCATDKEQYNLRGSARKWDVVSAFCLFCVRRGVKTAAARRVTSDLFIIHTIADVKRVDSVERLCTDFQATQNKTLAAQQRVESANAASESTSELAAAESAVLDESDMQVDGTTSAVATTLGTARRSRNEYSVLRIEDLRQVVKVATPQIIKSLAALDVISEVHGRLCFNKQRCVLLRMLIDLDTMQCDLARRQPQLRVVVTISNPTSDNIADAGSIDEATRAEESGLLEGTVVDIAPSGESSPQTKQADALSTAQLQSILTEVKLYIEETQATSLRAEAHIKSRTGFWSEGHFGGSANGTTPVSEAVSAGS